MKDGEHSVVHGIKNKAQVLVSGVLSEATTAEMHRKQAEPGVGRSGLIARRGPGTSVRARR